MLTQKNISDLLEITKKLAAIEQWNEPRLPCDYLVIDIETLGFLHTDSEIIQFGMCLVRDCKPVVDELWPGEYTSMIVKLPEEAFVGKEGAGKVHGIDYAKSQAEGLPKEDVLLAVKDTLDYAISNGMQIVGHNLANFDIPFIIDIFQKHGIHYEFPKGTIVDTGMMVKAMQLGMMPGYDERIWQWMKRVSGMRARGVYWSLDKFCMKEFGLEKHGASADAAHDAGYDCYLTHLVVTEINGMLDELEGVDKEMGEIPW